MQWIERLTNCWQSNHRYDCDATIELWLGYEDDGRLDSSYRSCLASSVQCPVTERACHVTRDHGRRPRASSVSSHICLELQIPVNKRLSIEPNRRRGAGELSLYLSLSRLSSSLTRPPSAAYSTSSLDGRQWGRKRSLYGPLTSLHPTQPPTHPLLLQVAVFYVFIIFFHFLLFSTV